eukprot:COSAG05_NODE_2165_length_3447_cov_8.954002_2_plen_81_part_00
MRAAAQPLVRSSVAFSYSVRLRTRAAVSFISFCFFLFFAVFCCFLLFFSTSVYYSLFLSLCSWLFLAAQCLVSDTYTPAL